MAPASPSVSTPVTPQPVVPDEPAWLASLLAPRCVAVLGADAAQADTGQAVLANLLANPFDGMVFPVSSSHRSLQGVRTVECLAAIPERIDVAIIAGDPESAVEAVSACAAAGVANAVLLGTGVWSSPLPERLRLRLRETAQRGRVRLLGPDSLGVLNPVTGFNGSSLSGAVKAGGIAFVSQSGSLCSTIVDWGLQEGVGFSGIVSLGHAIDVGWADLIEHFGNDPHTRAILLVIDELGDARRFLSSARLVAMDKPIIAMRSQRLATTARSSSGALPFAADEVFAALLSRAGVLSVDSITDLFGAAELLGSQPRPTGKRLAIVTNSGNPGLQAADLVIGDGNEIATLSRETTTALARELAAAPGVGSGIGVLADPPPSCFAAAARLAAEDPASDGVLLILSPQGRTEPTVSADLVIDQLRGVAKPVFASWMGGSSVEEGRRRLHAAGIPHFAFPDTAARAWNTLCRYGDRIRHLYETPDLVDEDHEAPDRLLVDRVLGEVVRECRTELTPREVAQVMAAYHLEPETSVLATTDQEAAQAAESFGFPVRLALHLDGQLASCHRRDAVGCLVAGSHAAVRTSFHALRTALQDIAGADAFMGIDVSAQPAGDGLSLTMAMEVDPVLGPIVGVGVAGALGAIYGDRSYAVPPLTTVLAKNVLGNVRLGRFFQQQDPATGGASMARELLRMSRLAIDHPRIRSIVIGAISARDDGIVTQGPRIEVFSRTVRTADLPRPLVRPYPSEHCSSISLGDGTAVDLRPVRSEDEPAFVRFHEQLSHETVRHRYAGADIPLRDRVAHARLIHRCQVDYDREIVLVAEVDIPGIGKDLIGVARLSRSRSAKGRAALHLVVADRWQSQGLEAALLEALLAIARTEGLTHLTAEFVEDDRTMRRLLAEQGFIIGDGAGPSRHADLLLN